MEQAAGNVQVGKEYMIQCGAKFTEDRPEYYEKFCLLTAAMDQMENTIRQLAGQI